MKKMLFLLMTGVILLLNAAPSNLLENADFEKVNKNWYLRAQKKPAPPEKQLEYVQQQPRAGAFCLKVSDTQTNSGHYLSYHRTVPQTAQSMRLEFYARTENPHTIRGGLLFNSGGKPVRYLGGQIKKFTVTREWQKFTVQCSIPAGARTLDLLICPTTQSYPETGSIYVDDVTLTEISGETMAVGDLGIDRTPAPRQDAPYAPAEGAIVKSNPPSFTFPAVTGWAPGKFTYSVEWSRNADFTGNETGRVTGTPFHAVIPETVLNPGKWYWRYGVENQNGKTQWSKVRSFTIPEDAPKQAWIPVEELAKRISKEDLRSYVTGEQVPAIRERAKNGDLKPLLDTMKKYMDPYVGRELQPEPPFLPKDPKARLKEFVRIMREMKFHRMQCFALMYLLSGDVKYGNEAKRQLLHFYGKWDPRGSTRAGHNDEPGMHIHSHGLPAYDLTRELFTPEERKIVENSMHIRMMEFYDILRKKPIEAHPYDSHAIYYVQLLGRLGLTLIHAYPEDSKKALDLALRFFWTYLHPFAFPDGGWSEGPAYGSWGVERLARFTHILRKTTGLDMQKIHPFFTYCGYYQLYGWPGRTRLTSFGDDNGTARTSQINTLRVCAALNNNPIFLKPGLDRKMPLDWTIWAALLNFGEEANNPDMSKLPLAYHFPSIGFAASRTDMQDYANDIGLVFQSNPVGAVSHHHNSHNCFILEAYEEPLAISSGYYDYYNSPHHDKWTRQTKSRNSITVDGGQGQMRGGHATGKLTKFVNSKDFDIIEGDASPAYAMLKTAIRTIVHVRPGIFVIRDRAESNKDKHIFEYNMHAHQPGVLDETNQTLTLKMPKAECLVKFYASTKWKFRSFDTFPVTPDRGSKPASHPEQWHFVASAPEAAMDLDLITVLMPYRTGEADKLPEVEKLPDGVKFIWKDGRTAIVRFAGDKVITEKNPR